MNPLTPRARPDAGDSGAHAGRVVRSGKGNGTMDTYTEDDYGVWLAYLDELLLSGAAEPRMREWEDLA